MEEEIQQDWDLHAVVRGCTATTSSSSASSTTTTTTTTSSAAAVQQDFNISSAYLGDLLQPKRETSKQDLLDLCKPFFHSSCSPSEITILPPRQQPSFSLLNLSKPQKSTPRNKKRKVNTKKVRHVAAEELSSDVWSWRKYGQKPIKGSPYPRGYYRCSTSKGCMARKQVERNRSDPGMFILTYTGDHNHPIPTHRNTSAAGSSFRPKPAAEGAPNLEESTTKPLPKELDTCQPDNDKDKDEEDNFIPLDDDFFEGLEGFAAGECSMDNSPVGFPAISDGGTAGS